MTFMRALALLVMTAAAVTADGVPTVVIAYYAINTEP